MRIFGSLAGVGAISWLSYARRIMMVPVSVVAQAAGMASYPFMAELFVKNDLSRFYRTINSALQNVLTLLVPLSIWMILVAEPTIRLIFQQGRFGVSDTAQHRPAAGGPAYLRPLLGIPAGAWAGPSTQSSIR